MRNPIRKTDDGPDVIEPDEPEITPGSEVEPDQVSDEHEHESLTSQAVHEPRPETSPPVKAVNMPL